MNPLTQLAAASLPSLIDLLKTLFVKQNPTAPVPTTAEVLAAYQQVLTSSIAVDEAWKAAHP